MQVRNLAECCPTATLDPLGFVRRSTQRLHAAIERDTPLARLADRDCTVEDYRAALGPLMRIYGTLDRQLVGAEHWRQWDVGPYRQRSPFLIEELYRWGQGCGPNAGDGPRLDSAAAYLGVRYVVDGAQFGHRVIAASLARSPAATAVAHRPGFWSTAFVSTAEWRRLCKALAGLDTRIETAQAARAARCTFELFSRELHMPLETAV